MISGQLSRRATARLMAVCAVLLGLFLMHGAPATAAEGCHSAMAHVTPIDDGHHHTAMSRATEATGDEPILKASPAPGMGGGSCVSTPAHDRISLPTPGLLAAAVFGALTAGLSARLRQTGAGTGRRGPPDGGRDLLNRVCIART
ncbi:hypothetical protein ACFW7J_10125 [Streptomyces sp. NPDC059525]|uniref:hypothetical protein n=1 Tax=Streptomyces sp. NPDC059525 TaxID=3346857 RepID=UPI0036964541